MVFNNKHTRTKWFPSNCRSFQSLKVTKVGSSLFLNRLTRQPELSCEEVETDIEIIKITEKFGKTVLG